MRSPLLLHGALVKAFVFQKTEHKRIRTDAANGMDMSYKQFAGRVPILHQNKTRE